VVEVSQIKFRIDSQDFVMTFRKTWTPLSVTDIFQIQILALPITSPSLKNGVNTAINITKGITTRERRITKRGGSFDIRIRTAVMKAYNAKSNQLSRGVSTTSKTKVKV
jgi:hypothetical protein